MAKKTKNDFEYVVVPHEGVGPIELGMSRDDVIAAMGRYRPTATKSNRLNVDQFHGWGLQAIYMGRKKTVQAIVVCDCGDIYGRNIMRPRYLTPKGIKLLGSAPGRVLERIAEDAECDPFVPKHPGAYCSIDLGLVLYYADFNDRWFGSLLLATPEYIAKYPPEYRVASQTEQ